MENQITIREAVTENDAAAFWEQLHAYHKRDIFTDSDKEELEYFLGQAYRDHMMNIYGRPQNRCLFLFFHRGGQDIGFAMPVIFTTEDGKCFIMEFCVYPEFRGSGTGKACAGTAASFLGIDGFYRKRCGRMGRTADAPAPGRKFSDYRKASRRPG